MKSKSLFRELQFSDIASLVYWSLLTLVILLFHKGLKNWGAYILGHLLIIAVIFGLAWAEKRRPSGWLAFIRDWYPVALVIFGFEEMNNLVTLIFPYWATRFLMGLDKAIFGVYPTVWLERLASPWLSEIMVFFLFAYFFMAAVGGGLLYAQGKRSEFYEVAFNVVLAYYLSFLLFLVFPAEGPWVIMKDLQTKALDGRLLTHLYYALQKSSSIRGGCFPSSHVAGAFAIALSMRKHHKKAFWGLLFLAAGVAVAVVYARYHHAVDSLAGIFIAAFAVYVGSRISALRQPRA
jgi:membrane-associated phospholipid phosphatase